MKIELKNHMSSIYKVIWQFQWESSLNGRQLWRIQPNVTKTENIHGFNRKEEIMIHQLRIGKCKLNYYQHIINQHEDGQCIHCKVSETIEHFLYYNAKNMKEKEG